jgi:triacylglycerol lipase
MPSRKIVFLLAILAANPSHGSDCVVLLHGLARVSNAMHELEVKLGRSGYAVANINYPSRKYSVPVLANIALADGLESCRERSAGQIHFVVHSMGGILLRYYLSQNEVPELGRSVMLGTPNKGAELVDRLHGWPGFSLLGPGAKSLGTDASGIVHGLGPVNFELGIIAGDTNINPLASLLLESENDSIVTVESTKVEGMQEHLVLPVIHTTMMRNNDLIDHVIHFLKTGNFIPE